MQTKDGMEIIGWTTDNVFMVAKKENAFHKVIDMYIRYYRLPSYAAGWRKDEISYSETPFRNQPK